MIVKTIQDPQSDTKQICQDVAAPSIPMCKKWELSNASAFSKGGFETGDGTKTKPTLAGTFPTQIYFAGSAFKLWWSRNTRPDPRLSETSRRRHFEKFLLGWRKAPRADWWLEF